MANYLKCLQEATAQEYTLNEMFRRYAISSRTFYRALANNECIQKAHEVHRRTMIEKGFNNIAMTEDPVSFTREKYLAEFRYKVNAPFTTGYDEKNLSDSAQNVRFGVQTGDITPSDAKILVDTLKAEMEVRKGSDMEQRVEELEKLFNSDTASVAKFEVEDGEE
jgi:hypothetical protein